MLWQTGDLLVQRMVSHGHTTDWMTQSFDEWVLLVQGEAEIAYKNGDVAALTRGDTLLIPAGVCHRVSKTSEEPPCVWVCLCKGGM